MPPATPAALSALLRRFAAASRDPRRCRLLHAVTVVSGFLPDTTLSTDLVLLYSKSSLLSDARAVFEQMPRRSMHSYNILLAAYGRCLWFRDAFALFAEMMASGVRPDRFTLPPALKSAGSLSPLLGMSVHCFSVCLGFDTNVVVQAALLHMYCNVGFLGEAVKVFDGVVPKDAFVWNCMVSGMARAGRGAEALRLFRLAQVDGTAADMGAVPSVLHVCGKDGELRKGREIHGRVIRFLAFDSDVAIGNALVDMYAKCGCVVASSRAFNCMRERNIVSWSSLISCYGVHGKGKEALMVYEEMLLHRIKPNSITFTSILTSCSHSCLVNEGEEIFKSMGMDYGIEPQAEHYACIVDLLGRAGNIEEALELIGRMPMVPCAGVWGALLSACAVHRNVAVGEVAAHMLFELEEGKPSNYITLCGIYDAVGQQQDVAAIRTMMRQLGMVKTPGCSWVDIKGKVHAFYQGNIPRCMRSKGIEVLKGLWKEMTILENPEELSDFNCY